MNLDAAGTIAARKGKAARPLSRPATVAPSHRFFSTGDGVRLHYLEAGSGIPVILLHGWSQSAALFKHQVDALANSHHVFAIDMRGHGDSDRPEHGYNIHRMAQDVREFIVARRLRDVVLVGHSMGVKIIWGYFELHGPDRLSKLVMADDSPCLFDNPAWSDGDRAEVGPMFTGQSLADLAGALAGPNGVQLTHDYVGAMFTPDYRARATDELAWVIEENLKLPRDRSAQLLLSIATIDWRGVIKRIRLPTLVMGGEASTHKTGVIAWEASQIPGAELKIWTAAEGGSHFAFLENPDAFNAVLAAFLSRG